MRDFVEYVIRGRWADVRPPSEQELKATMVWPFRWWKPPPKCAPVSPSMPAKNMPGPDGQA